MILPFQAANADHITVPAVFFGLDDSVESLYILDPTGVPVNEISLSFFTTGGMGLAIHPTISGNSESGHFYAALIDEEGPNRVLAVLDPVSFGVTQIGTGFSDGTNALSVDEITFHSDGTLYVVTDDTETLYTQPLDGSNAIELCTMPFSADSGGEVIAFNGADVLHRISGENPPVFQTVNLTDCSTTTVTSFSTLSDDFFTSLTFTGTEFLGSTVTGNLFSISESGTLTMLNEELDGLPVYGGLVQFDPNAAPPTPPDDDNDGIQDNIETALAPSGEVVPLVSTPSNVFSPQLAQAPPTHTATTWSSTYSPSCRLRKAQFFIGSAQAWVDQAKMA